MTAWPLRETEERTVSGDTEDTRILAKLVPGGAVLLSGVDSGPSVARAYVDWDRECRAKISPTDQPKARAALAAHARTAARPQYWSALIQLLKGWGVTRMEGSWS